MLILCSRKVVEKDQHRHKPPTVHVQLVPFFYGRLRLPLTVLSPDEYRICCISSCALQKLVGIFSISECAVM